MNCKIITQNGISVLTLSGHLSVMRREDFSACAKQTLEAEAKSVVIYFKDVSAIDIPLHRELTLLQHELRKTNRQLRLVGLNTALRTELLSKGVVRASELGQSLAEVITTLAKT